MYRLYPEIEPFRSHDIDTGDGHQLYVEESGTLSGTAVLGLHGGPGGQSHPTQRRLFDPQRTRIVLFDQRGSGRSQPLGDLDKNSTPYLIEDIERIRKALGIERWLVWGSSWGATLAMLYASQAPQHIAGLLLQGLFCGRRRDIDWIYRGEGANRLYPDAWQAFLRPLNASDICDPLQAYYQKLHSGDELQRLRMAQAWIRWESSLAMQKVIHEHGREPSTLTALAKVQSHYLVHDCFMPPDALWDAIEHLQNTPTIVVHGRNDTVCPLDGVWHLCQRWPRAELRVVHGAGHIIGEPTMIDAMIHAGRQLLRTLS